MAEPIRILVLDDRQLVARTLATALQVEEDLQVIDAVHTVDAAAATLGARRVDVVIARIFTRDGGLPDLRSRFPDQRCVALSPSDGFCFIRAAFEAGAQGFALETLPPEILVRAVRMVHAGRRFFPDCVSERLPEAMALDALTERELDVLKYLGEGLNNGAIADALGLGVGTVKVHIHKILNKLNAESRTEAVARAHVYGLLDISKSPRSTPS